MLRSLPYGRRYLSPTADTNPGGGNPPAGDPPNPPAGDPAPGGNDENKFRRLHEKSETEKAALAARVAELEAAEKTRKDAELSELERANNRAVEAEKKAADLEHARLRNEIGAQHNLTPEAMKLLTGTDAASLTENAVALAAIMKQPVTAGSTTQPSSTPPPSLDERIKTAVTNGNQLQAIALMRQKQGITK